MEPEASSRSLTLDDLEREILEIDLAPEEEREAKFQNVFKVAVTLGLDDATAARAVNIILSRKEQLARIKAACASQIGEASRRLSDSMEILTPALEGWAATQRHGKAKHIKLPTGRVGWRTTAGGALEVEDEAALRNWAEANCPEAIKYEQAPIAKEPIKKTIEAGGAVPPGCRITESEEHFYVSE